MGLVPAPDSGLPALPELLLEGLPRQPGPRPRSRTVRLDGLLERRFQRGIAVVNPPGAPARSGPLDRLYRDLDGNPRPFVALAGGQALVLTR